MWVIHAEGIIYLRDGLLPDLKSAFIFLSTPIPSILPPHLLAILAIDRLSTQGLEAKGKPVVITGDLNCAHKEIDIHDPKVWQGASLHPVASVKLTVTGVTGVTGVTSVRFGQQTHIFFICSPSPLPLLCSPDRGTRSRPGSRSRSGTASRPASSTAVLWVSGGDGQWRLVRVSG